MRIGIDIGGTSIKIGLVNDAYEIVDKKILYINELPAQAKEQITYMAEAVKNLLAEHHKSQGDCTSLGIACPGMVSPDLGMVWYSNNLGWENVNLFSECKKHLQIPLALANDADAAVYGETICGAAAGRKNVLLLTLGTGVGGGLVLNNRLFTGAMRGGFEPGHIAINQNGKQCTCGRRGCLERYASATALMELGKEVAKENPDSKLWEICEQDLTRLDGKMIFDCAKEEDASACSVVSIYEEALASGITSLVNLFRPEMVLLGGGVSAQEEYLTDALTQIVKRDAFGTGCGEIPPIRICQLGNDAGIIGAAFL